MCSVGWEWAENIQLIGSGSGAAAAAKTKVSVLEKKEKTADILRNNVYEKIDILYIVSRYKYVARCY